MGSLLAPAIPGTGSTNTGALVTTTDATPVLVAELFAPNDGSMNLIAKWTANNGGIEAFSGSVFVQVRVVSTIAAIDSPASGEGHTRLSDGWNVGNVSAKPAVTFTVSGLDKFVQVYAKGKAATTIFWTFAFESIEAGT